MENIENKTLVGIPFYDGEGPDVLAACLRNVDTCLNNLGIDAEVVVGINGPRVSKGNPPLSDGLDRSQYNASVRFIKTPPGLVAAERTICRHAVDQGFSKIYLTDADITRLPRSMRHMWHQGNRPLVGSNYATYPPEIIKELNLGLQDEAIMLMKIFEADKHPCARKYTSPHRPRRRLKGSLLLVKPEIGMTMFGNQGITSDSRMNNLISDDDKQVVLSAVFMHYPRTDITDYVQARMRHLRAAAAEGNLDAHSKQEVIYSRDKADQIADQIREDGLDQEEIASNFLKQCALRHEVVRACRRVIQGKHPEFPKQKSGALQETVQTFEDATKVIQGLLSERVDWQNLNAPITNGKGVTQTNLPRAALDLEPALANPKSRQLILEYVGLEYGTQV